MTLICFWYIKSLSKYLYVTVGENVVKERFARIWFQKFNSDDKIHEDAPWSEDNFFKILVWEHNLNKFKIMLWRSAFTLNINKRITRLHLQSDHITLSAAWEEMEVNQLSTI